MKQAQIEEEILEMNKQIYLYKALRKGKKSDHGNHKWKIGKWYKVDGNLSMCRNGFHASENIIDTMQYVNMEWLAKCEVRGESIKQSDKQCWSEMRVIETRRWGKEDSVRLAIYAASLVLKNYENKYPDDKRPREAIKATRDYLKTKDKKAARSAAESATRSAWSAWSAARSATRSAWLAARAARSAARPATWSAWLAAESAESAVRSAAESATWSAWSAARSAAESAESATRSAGATIKLKCHNWILKRINL